MLWILYERCLKKNFKVHKKSALPLATTKCMEMGMKQYLSITVIALYQVLCKKNQHVYKPKPL